VQLSFITVLFLLQVFTNQGIEANDSTLDIGVNRNNLIGKIDATLQVIT
jgi:hypothetical protein